jgi:Lipocalin-like domain
VAAVSGCGSNDKALEAPEALAGAGQGTWTITSRVENGGAAGLPACAKDDVLIFKTNGKFDSLINNTACNPAEVDVRDGSYSLSADNQTINFDVGGFKYSGKLLEFSPDKLVIEFDLGPGFSIKDTFALKT